MRIQSGWVGERRLHDGPFHHLVATTHPLATPAQLGTPPRQREAIEVPGLTWHVVPDLLTRFGTPLSLQVVSAACSERASRCPERELSWRRNGKGSAVGRRQRRRRKEPPGCILRWLVGSCRWRGPARPSSGPAGCAGIERKASERERRGAARPPSALWGRRVGRERGAAIGGRGERSEAPGCALQRGFRPSFREEERDWASGFGSLLLLERLSVQTNSRSAARR